MTYKKVKRMENRKDYWRNKAKKLFMKYSTLNNFDFDILDDRISCYDPHTGETKNYYCNATRKEEYKELKKSLDLEIEICYKDYRK